MEKSGGMEIRNAPVHAGEGGYRRLVGLRILVAEDNPTNQQVARELLEDEGAMLDIVSNGLAAVVAVSESTTSYDVVLMDLQMPVMDGITATRKIRSELGKKTLPIVAMTANVMSQDREACLKAGMNEHVGKPFDLDNLVSVILKVSNKGVLPGVARDDNVQECIDPAILAQAKACGIDLPVALKRLGGNVGTYRRLLKNFIDDLDATPAAMREALLRGQNALLSRQAHTLKGVCATLGFMKMAELAAHAESVFERSDVQENEPELVSFLKATSQLTPPLKAFFEAMQAQNEEALKEVSKLPTDTGKIVQTLKSLQVLLADLDMESVNVIENLRTMPWGEHSKELQRIDEAVVELQFEEAKKQCAAFLEKHDA